MAASNVDTLFLHEVGDGYRVAVHRNGDRVLDGRLEVTVREAGPRPGRFRVTDGDTSTPRPPTEFVDLARRARNIRISEQTSRDGRAELQELLAGYQLDATVVRTCRYCATAGRYGPISADTAIASGDDLICPDCARRELRKELAYTGTVTQAAEDRLEELLLEVQDLERITSLLRGGMDPELTKVDELDATTEAVNPVPVTALDLHPELAAILRDRFEQLMPVQSLSVEEGLLQGNDQLVVSATATGKTLVGELAGIDRVLRGAGTLLFLVPLVALANQTYDDFRDSYGELVDVTLRVGASRIRSDGRAFDPNADVIVGTYEGIDHALRTGRDLGDIGTVVIDEIHSLTDEDRGHRLDGLIARLHDYCSRRRKHQGGNGTQWIYLSATVGNPEWLAERLDSRLIAFEERPVPIERHLTFADGPDKPAVCNQLVKREFDRTSSKGYRGQTIVFTNSRRRCQELAGRLDYPAAPYHAGLDGNRRRQVEHAFGDQDLAAVVTTAALAAGVDFPASQVVFDSLAMGIEWLTVQEFQQMLGRAGRPDYHDRGLVYLLVEPDGRYHGGMERTEDEVAFELLKGQMEDVALRYDENAAIEETLANLVVGGERAKALNDAMVGEVPTKYALGKLLEYGMIEGLSPTPLGRAVCTHFLAPDETFTMLDGIRSGENPFDVLAEVDLLGDDGT